MISEKDILADMHTHTTFSKHAFSSVKENINAARERKLKYIAITDHYFGNGDEIEKKNEVNRIQYLGLRINHMEPGITVIGSAEFNLGQEIYTPEKLKDLVWRPIGLHSWFVDRDNLTIDDVYNLFVEAHHNGHNAFHHIEREFHRLNHGLYSFEECMTGIKRIIDYAHDNDIWLEANESSIFENDGQSAERLCEWLKYAKEKGCKIFLGSDAHYCGEVGYYPNLIRVLNEIEYPKELILNCNKELLEKIFNSN